MNPTKSTIDPKRYPAAAFALDLLQTDNLAQKLEPPKNFQVEDRGPVHVLREPRRNEKLAFTKGVKIKVPPIAGMRDPRQRARILHALANHELQAAELFAWAILAFGESPRSFRLGLLRILSEEQLHCRLYIERMETLGASFGDFPVSGHFWHNISPSWTPLDFVCTMGLTYENANLDFAQEYERAARETSDLKTAEVLARVHQDEIRHVAFAWRWMKRFKLKGEDEVEAYQRSVSAPLGLHRARGKHFDPSARDQAGLSPHFTDAMKHSVAKRPNGLPR